MKDIRLIALDLDGTVTQHRTPIEPEAWDTLERLSRRYRLVFVGAGTCFRIWEQLRRFPVDVIGNYGMQTAAVDSVTGSVMIHDDPPVPCSRTRMEARVSALRSRFDFNTCFGDGVVYHPTGCITIPLLGADAPLEMKLAFDPDRSRRRAVYRAVTELFPEYRVFIGGTSSFDMAPQPYDKAYALRRYCAENGIGVDETLFIGDDFGEGGNDEAVGQSEFACLSVSDYRAFPGLCAEKLL